MDKETIRKAEEKALDITKKQAWPVWVKHLVSALIGAIAGVLAMTCTGCTYTSAQVGADGSTEQRVFALDAATARDFVKLYGVPGVPVVNVGK